MSHGLHWLHPVHALPFRLQRGIRRPISRLVRISCRKTGTAQKCAATSILCSIAYQDLDKVCIRTCGDYSPSTASGLSLAHCAQSSISSWKRLYLPRPGTKDCTFQVGPQKAYRRSWSYASKVGCYGVVSLPFFICTLPGPAKMSKVKSGRLVKSRRSESGYPSSLNGYTWRCVSLCFKI